MTETSGVNKASLSTGVSGIRGCELRSKSLKKVPLQDLCTNIFKGA